MEIKKLTLKHLKSFIIKIHWLTYIYLIASIVTGQFYLYSLCLCIMLIHEFSHTIMAYLLGFDIKGITLLPFGAYLTLKNLFRHSIIEEICVALAGPGIHLFIHILINMIFEGELRNYLSAFNSFVFYFNLIPVYPMDGYRIVSLILQSIIDLKKSLYFSLKISVLCFVLLSIFYIELSTYVIIFYLLFQQFILYRDIPQYLRQYFGYIPNVYKNHHIYIHKNLSYRRDYHNYYLINQNIYYEDKMVSLFLKRLKKL